MIVMLDTNHDLKTCSQELGGYPTEQLLTPLTRYRNRYPENHFAIDNGAFSKFDKQAFLALLEREKSRQDLCRFVAVPDVVASARRTLEVFEHWYEIIHQQMGWRVALVAQDGQEDLPIEWHLIDAIFIGGSTKWKESDCAKSIVKAAKMLDKWVHVGRINSRDRFTAFEEWGADSCDGSGIAQYSWQRERLTKNPPLFSRQEMTLNV